MNILRRDFRTLKYLVFGFYKFLGCQLWNSKIMITFYKRFDGMKISFESMQKEASRGDHLLNRRRLNHSGKVMDGLPPKIPRFFLKQTERHYFIKSRNQIDIQEKYNVCTHGAIGHYAIAFFLDFLFNTVDFAKCRRKQDSFL